MKKFISLFFIFILFAFFIYASSIFLWGTFAPTSLKPNLNYRIGSKGHLFSRIQEIKKINSVDILFLGSSHAYRGFDPRIFTSHKLKTFNLGSSSQTPVQTLLLLKRYLDHIKPKSIVYEVYPETFMIDGIESSLDIIANDKNDALSFKMAYQLNHIKTYNTLIYGLIKNLLSANDSFNEPVQKKGDTYVKGGFVEAEMKYYTPTSFPPKKIVIDKKHLPFFKEIIHEIKKRNITLTLVFAPVSASFYTSYTNTNDFDHTMSSYAPMLLIITLTKP
ncbi:hypothetical protein [Aquimarina agarilytica]|uniref:hypothetical protein n=1 Tax=Aquimarina agarilytica TaxID=1087449 RepID=UPI000289BE33|nr:hypothetical protein [Aquimarina agarilytica]